MSEINLIRNLFGGDEVLSPLTAGAACSRASAWVPSCLGGGVLTDAGIAHRTTSSTDSS